MKTGPAWIILAVTVAGCGRRPEEPIVIPANTDAQRRIAALPGKTFESREKIRQGMPEKELRAALGLPTEKRESRGQIVSGTWSYFYADGKIVIKLRDGMITEIETTFY